MTICGEAALTALRGGMPIKPLDARRIAGSLDQPGCARRQLLDAAAVPIDELANLLGCPDAGQSPFAITRGNAFERLVFDNGMAKLIALVRKHLGFDITRITQVDLSAEQIKATFGRCDNHLRARETRRHLSAMLAGDPSACCLIRHAMLTFEVGGMTTYLEADALCFYTGGQLTVVEVKSFPAIDGHPDPAKTAAAIRQSAVYILALRAVVAELGYDPSIVSTRVLLVLTRDFTLNAVGFVRDIATSVHRLQRLLNRLPVTAEIAITIPAGASLPALPSRGASLDERKQAAREAGNVVGALAARFGDSCMSCPLFRFCRDEARARGEVTTAGSAVAEICGDVHTVDLALELATGNRPPANSSEFAVASHLGRAATVSARLAATLAMSQNA